MSGSGRGGGGRQPSYAAPDGADAAAIKASRKMVKTLKRILAHRSEDEIYATLCDCGMDPDITVERLISQDTFHELRRKQDKKKEVVYFSKVNQETRPRPFQKSIYQKFKASSGGSGRDSTGGFKGPVKKEPELHAPLNSSASDIKTSDTTETFSATGNVAQADAKNTTSQPPSQVQHGWGGILGPSMAEIVKMSRPQAKVGSRSVANSTAMPAISDSIISNTPNLAPKEYNKTDFASEVGHGAADKLPNCAVEVPSVPKDASSLDMLPSAEGTDVGAPSMSANSQGSSTPYANEDDIENDANLEEGNTESLTTPGQVSASGKDIQSEYTEVVSHLDEGSIEKTDDFQLNSLSFEHNQNLTGDVSTTTTQFDHLTLHEGSKLSDDNPAVIIPDHLQVSNADCAHLTFGSFVFGTLDASLTTKPVDSHGDVATVPDDDSIDQSDGRIHDNESKVTLAPAANEYVTSAANSNVENLDITSVQQSEVTRANFLDVTSNTEYNLSSTPDYATSSAALQDSASQSYLQENRQFQNISPLSSFMQIQNGLLPPAIPPLREFDAAFSLLLTNPPMMHGTMSSSMSNATVSTQPQENANPVGLPNPQLTQSQPGTSIASGPPPLPQHLLHPYAQATLPLGYTSMIGYSSLPPSYAYLPPAAFQQPYMNSGLFHPAAAADSSVKYPLPQYKSNIALAGLPQPGSLLSSYVRGFGTANNMPGNFPLNQSTSKGDLMEVEAAVRHVVELHPSRTTRIITDERDVIVCERGSISSLPSTSSQSSHVEEAHEKRDENKIDAFVAKPVTTTVFQYMKGADLVGIEEAVNDLMKILTEGNEMSMSQGKIVSIVGPGGLGKTTLAHAIYGKLRAQFDCWAFVSVSQNPDMMKLLKCMLYQLGKKNSANIHEEILDERLLIYKLTEFLQKRRYFIVIDDIQDISIWRIIKCSLPATNDGCIIVTTTRVLDVAKQVGVTYMMRPLCLENSRILLHRRIFGTGDKGKYVDDELIKISEKILRRCGGIPLSIIMISGLLATKGRNKIEWDKIYRSMKYSDPSVGGLKTIVSLCYQDLPSHLKTFLLYLSVFPEGYDIDKDRLIRLWIGEGLIQCGKQDESPFELGESYFWELINRCMIQPMYKRWYYDMTECCHMHDMVLDLISGKEKLVPLWNHMHHTFHSQEVQWLSLQNSMLDHATHWATMNMQGVRSVVVFPSAVKLLPDLACFRDLLVLDLQSCCLSQGCSLKHLGNLVHLRYLGLRDTGISHLSEVGKLQCLQTLDVRRNEISSLPSTVNELKHLMCLHIDSWTRAPNGIGSFTLLEELSTLCIQDSTDMIEELGNLTELRVLGIDCCTEWNVNGVEKSLVECLHKLQKIRTLSISMVGECNLDAWVAPQHLRRLELTGCWLSTVPALLNDPSLLLELSFLSMEVRKLGQEDLERLGRLPALSYLDIEVGNQKLGTVQTFTIGARSFPCLVHCTLRGYIGTVVFQQGAMPEVARLHLVFPVREIRESAGINSGFDLGFGNLLRLRDVSFLLRRGGASKGEVEEAEAALRQAIEGHPNRPTLEIL